MESKLQCPNCRCPLTSPSSAATGMTCPRCTTWVEFQAQCGGGCMSCFKAKTSENGNHCSDETTAGSLVREKPHSCCSAESSSDAGEPRREKGNLLVLGWKRLFQRIFAVR
jgi:hypothetical protein